MPLAAAIVPAALGVGGSIFGAVKQAGAQKQALAAQERARQDALAEKRAASAMADRRRAAAKADYENRARMYYQKYGEDAVKRYGYLPGFKADWLTQPGAAGGAPAPGVGAGEMVTLGGGRQVPRSEYDAYVARRDSRPDVSLGGMIGHRPPGMAILT